MFCLATALSVFNKNQDTIIPSFWLSHAYIMTMSADSVTAEIPKAASKSHHGKYENTCRGLQWFSFSQWTWISPSPRGLKLWTHGSYFTSSKNLFCLFFFWKFERLQSKADFMFVRRLLAGIQSLFEKYFTRLITGALFLGRRCLLHRRHFFLYACTPFTLLRCS